MISSSSETKQNPGFSFHSHVSHLAKFSSPPGIILPFPSPPREDIWGEGEIERWLRRSRGGWPFLPKCRKTFCSFLSMSSWSWHRRSAYCCCLIFWIMGSASWSKDMATVRHPSSPTCSGGTPLPAAHCTRPQSPGAAPDPSPHLGLLGWCCLAQPFLQGKSCNSEIST